MPVTGATTRNDYVATSGQNVFAYTFQILLRSDLKVLKNGAALTLNNDYTVAITGQSGGFITLNAPASAGDTVNLFLAMPIDRTTEYQNAGDFLASDVNGDFDKGYIAMNQLQTDIARSIGLKDYDPSVDMTLPVAGSRANKFLKFNAQGLPVADTGIPVGEAFITPAQFGALGDGSDDTAAILALVDYVKANGGGTIDLEDKTYSVGATIAFGVPITLLCGSGAGFRALTSGSFTSITGRSGEVNINPDNGNPYTVLFDIDGMGYSSFQGRFILTSNGQERLMGGEVKYIPNLVAIAQQDGTGPVQALNGYFESLYVTRLHCAFFQPEKVVNFGPVLPYTRTFFARLEIIKCYQAWNFLHVNGFDDCAVGILRVNKCAANSYAKAFDLDCLEAFFAGGKATATGTFSTTATSTAFTVSADADIAVGDAIMVKGAETYGQGFVTKIATLSGTSGTFEDTCPVAVTDAEFIFAAGGFDMDRATFVCAKLYLEGVHHKLLYFIRQATLDCQTLKFSTGEFACYKGRPIVFEHINSLCNIGSIPQSEHGVNGNPLVDDALGKLIQSYVYYGLREFRDIQIPPDTGPLFTFYPNHNCTIKMMMTRQNFVDFGIEPIVVGHTIYDPAGFPGGIREYSTSNSQLFVEYSDQTVKVSGDIGGPALILDSARSSGLSVESFGAVGDGVTDDTAALQAAFSYGNTTRTKITMQGKTYLYSGLLATITNSVEVEGAGDGTILLKDDSYTGAAFVIDNTFGQIPEFYPNSAGDQNLVADLNRVKSPSFSKFSIIGKSRAYAGFGFEFKDRNDMVSIQDVNCFNLKGSAFRFTGTFGNLRESNIRRLVVRMCGDENYPAVDLKMPSFSNTQVTSSTVGGKTRFTLSGTGDNFSGLTGNRKIRVQGSRNDGGTKEWPVESIVSNTVVELPYDITSIDPETGETYGQAVTNAPTTFYRDVDGLNHIAFNDCQIVGCYGTYLRISHDRVNFFRRVVFNNLMIHGSNKKYQDDAQQGPSGDLILIEGGIGSVDFRGLRLNTNEVDKSVTPNILYAGMRVRAGQTITQDIPDRVWINDLDMLNLNNDGEAMFVIEKVKNMSVNGTVAASSQSGTELKVAADAVTVGLDYNVIPGTSKNIRNVGVLPAFSIDSTVADKVFITLNQRKETSISEDDYRELTSDINQNARLGDTRFSRLYRANLVKNAPNVGATQAATEWTLADGRMAYIPARKAGATVLGTWTASSTIGEYYLETTASTRLTDVSQVIEDNYMILNEGTLGSLGYGEWKVGDNDSLGYNTLYVKPLAPVSPASLGETDLRYKQAADGSVVRVTRRTFYGGDLPNTGYYYNGDLFYDFTPSATTGDPVAWICRVRGFGDVGQIGGTATWEVFGVIDG